MSKKRIATLITILVLSVAVAVPSIVSAAESTASTRPGSITSYFKELLQGLVDSGKLSQTDADATLNSLDEKIAEMKENRPEKSDGRFGVGRVGNLDLTEVASVIGLTEDQLKEQLAAGATLWKIAGNAGKLDALKTAIIEKAQARLGEWVTDGRMTQQEADESLSALKEKVAAITADTTETDSGDLVGHDRRAGRDGNNIRGGNFSPMN